MKAQRRRFVVEVKRGTSRASFISTDAAAEKFSLAEDALFGPKTKPAAVPDIFASAPSAKPSLGRVLRDLHEPSPPPLPEAPPPARRGRKPGSKNKPKPVLANTAVPPKPARTSARPVWADAVAAQYASLGAPAPHAPAPSPGVAPTAVTPSKGEGEVSTTRRMRLRDRSSILKRYVLGTEPAPGQTGWVRSLRSKRLG